MTRWQAKDFGPPYSRFEVLLFVLMAANVAELIWLAVRP